MIKKSKKESTIFKGAILLGVSSLLSRFLGVLRDRIIASEFGISGEIDAYFAAFRIPDFIFNLLVLGALSSAFVPVFTHYLSKNKKEAFSIANSLLTLTMILLIVISVVVFIFTPFLVQFLGLGFDDSKKKICVDVTRILLLSPIFFGISTIFTGILNSFKKFFLCSLAPILYNIGIIVGALFLSKYFGIYGLSIGVIAGAFLHALIQLPGIIKVGFKYRFQVKLLEGVKRIGTLMLPRTIGLGAMQLNLFIITVLATLLPEGSVAIFNYANNLQSFPVAVFGFSFATSSFPFLAEAISKNNQALFQMHFQKTLVRILYFIVPISIIMLVLREQIVRLILGAGKFTWEATLLTSETLGYFSVSLFASALVVYLARTFYALQNTKTPVIVSLISIALNIALSYFLSSIYGVKGLAIAFSITTILQSVFLILLLKKEVHYLNLRKILKRIVVIFFASGIILLISSLLLRSTKNIFDLTTFIGVLLESSFVFIFSCLIYFLITLFFKDQESLLIFRKIIKNKC